MKNLKYLFREFWKCFFFLDLNITVQNSKLQGNCARIGHTFSSERL